MCSVRGIGVAVIVSTSTVGRSAFSRSFTSTPNRCSSSMITRPRLWKLHVGRRQPVRADHDVERPVGRPLDDLALLLRRAEPRERGDLERKLGHPRGERAAMLLGQHRRRHQHGHLVAGVDRLERRAHRQLRLAEADVAAQQPIHRPRLLHVVLDGVDRRELVGRFLVGKRGVELALPLGVGRKRDAGPRVARPPAARACRRPDR